MIVQRFKPLRLPAKVGQFDNLQIGDRTTSAARARDINRKQCPAVMRDWIVKMTGLSLQSHQNKNRPSSKFRLLLPCSRLFLSTRLFIVFFLIEHSILDKQFCSLWQVTTSQCFFRTYSTCVDKPSTENSIELIPKNANFHILNRIYRICDRQIISKHLLIKYL